MCSARNDEIGVGDNLAVLIVLKMARGGNDMNNSIKQIVQNIVYIELYITNATFVNLTRSIISSK